MNFPAVYPAKPKFTVHLTNRGYELDRCYMACVNWHGRDQHLLQAQTVAICQSVESVVGLIKLMNISDVEYGRDVLVPTMTEQKTNS